MALSFGCVLATMGWMATTAHAANGQLHGMTEPRYRVIIDNDFGGDPDGLFQLAHELLSPSVVVSGIIGSHNYPGGFYGDPGTAEFATKTAGRLLSVMGLAGKIPLIQGSEGRLTSLTKPNPSEAAKFIVHEAMRDDSRLPLYVLCGAGLTDIASAYLLEPRIAQRLVVVWIGGPEYPGLDQPPPGKPHVEYNLGIDVIAARVVFNTSTIPIWQVPRDSYRQCLVSLSELEARIGGGKLGDFLLGRLARLELRAKGRLGEAYVLGDSPLVLLTALQSPWEADPSSSRYAIMKAPTISESGWYKTNPSGRPIRVYTALDTRLLFEDLFAKIAKFDAHAAPSDAR